VIEIAGGKWRARPFDSLRSLRVWGDCLEGRGVARPTGFEPVAFGSGGYPERKLVHSRPRNYGVGCHLARPPEACKMRVFWKTLRVLASGVSCYCRSVSHSFRIELELEDDGRWIAEIPTLAGVLCYGATRDEAIAHVQALALRVLAERLDHAEAPAEFLNVSFLAA